MRAQTTLDFAIGMSVFLLAVVFVFTFAPGILEPFEAGPQEETAVADRVASQLVHTSLAEPKEPFVLTRDCTDAFFNFTADGETACGFDHTVDLTAGGELTDRVGIVDRQRIRISIVADTNGDGEVHVLCYVAAADTIVEETSSTPTCGESTSDSIAERAADADILYRIGDTPSNTQAVVVSRRTVSLDGITATVRVEVW